MSTWTYAWLDLEIRCQTKSDSQNYQNCQRKSDSQNCQTKSDSQNYHCKKFLICSSCADDISAPIFSRLMILKSFCDGDETNICEDTLKMTLPTESDCTTTIRMALFCGAWPFWQIATIYNSFTFRHAVDIGKNSQSILQV